jgi:hypothetical protein
MPALLGEDDDFGAGLGLEVGGVELMEACDGGGGELEVAFGDAGEFEVALGVGDGWEGGGG